MERAHVAALQQCPEARHAVRVRFLADVLANGMPDGQVPVADAFEALVTPVFVGVER